MTKKKVIALSCMIALSVCFLIGCGKNKVNDSNTYSIDKISEIQIDIDTWQLNIMASSDEKAHISFDGNISDNVVEPTALLQDNILKIAQNNDEELQDQIALGKKGQITIHLPTDCTIPITISNEIGDIEVDSISIKNLQLLNNAGYVTFTNFEADNLKVSSMSGDITVKTSDIDNVDISATSGYIKLSNTTFISSEIATKSGEINMSEISTNTNIHLQTGSGDINLSYKTSPDNLDFSVSSGSKDITIHFNKESYEKETSACRQGITGEGQNKLEINSDNGTVVVK